MGFRTIARSMAGSVIRHARPVIRSRSPQAPRHFRPNFPRDVRRGMRRASPRAGPRSMPPWVGSLLGGFTSFSASSGRIRRRWRRPFEAAVVHRRDSSPAGTDARRGFRRWASRSVLRRWPFVRSGGDVRRPPGSNCPIAGSSGSDGRSAPSPMPCACRLIHGHRMHRIPHASIPHWPPDRSSSIPCRRCHRVVQVESPARSRVGSGRSSRRSVTRLLPRSSPTVADSPRLSRAGCRSPRRDEVSPRLSSCCESLARSPREASRRSVGGSIHVRGIATPWTAVV